MPWDESECGGRGGGAAGADVCFPVADIGVSNRAFNPLGPSSSKHCWLVAVPHLHYSRHSDHIIMSVSGLLPGATCLHPVTAADALKSLRT